MATGHARLGASAGCIPEASCHWIRDTAHGHLLFQAQYHKAARVVRTHHHRMGRHGIGRRWTESPRFMPGLQIQGLHDRRARPTDRPRVLGWQRPLHRLAPAAIPLCQRSSREHPSSGEHHRSEARSCGEDTFRAGKCRKPRSTSHVDAGIARPRAGRPTRNQLTHSAFAPNWRALAQNGEAVHIQDLQQEHEVSTLEEFERVLAQRYGNEVNGFWINRRRNLLPLLLILVNKAYAYMLYSPMKTATRLSLGGTPSRHDPDHDTIFFANRIEEPEVFPNFAVIALADAIAAAKQLFASTALPRCVEWFEP
jgi:hypothetical protein